MTLPDSAIGREGPAAGLLPDALVDVPTSHLVMDASMRLAMANASTGLGRMSHALQATGHAGRVAFIPMPDLSVTSNTARRQAGFSYGGLLLWDESARIQFPDIRPNACGVALVAAPGDVSASSLLPGVEGLKAALGADWDYGRGNHFIALYRSPTESYLLVHGGSARAKRQSRTFVGMYPESSQWIREHSTLLETPYGRTRILRDDPADEYCAQYRQVEKEARAGRREICETLLPGARVVFEGTHQGLVAPNAASLGVYVGPAGGASVPMMIGPGEPLLMAAGGCPVLRLLPESLPADSARAQLFRRCTTWTLTPHGSGDYFPDARQIEMVGGDGSAGHRYRVELRTGSRLLVSDIGRLPERWRSYEEAARALAALGIGRNPDLAHVLSIL